MIRGMGRQIRGFSAHVAHLRFAPTPSTKLVDGFPPDTGDQVQFLLTPSPVF